jgi:MoxR-like ATPase
MKNTPDKPYFKDQTREGSPIISRFWDVKAQRFTPKSFGGSNYGFDLASMSMQELPGDGFSMTMAPYIPDDDLIEAVRLAQLLRRPILLKGEPGSGKTQLARSLAYEWYGHEFRKYLFEWNVKSTSKASDGISTFDQIERLRDAQLHIPDLEKTKYRQFGPMAKAFLSSTETNPTILLIDEIDKADIDFPNDLLLELDERRFFIPETGEVLAAQHAPVIFITSNDERELPQAFLRRCLFVYLKFPASEQLQMIVAAHYPKLVDIHRAFVTEAIDYFQELRNRINSNPSEFKTVSTSELLDWLKAFDLDLRTGRISIPAPMRKDGMPHYFQTLIKTYSAYFTELQKK